MNSSLFSQGIDLLLYGMGTVFAFLSVMVVVLLLLERLVRRFAHEESAPAAARPATSAVAQADAISAQHRQAIEKAIKLHLKK